LWKKDLSDTKKEFIAQSGGRFSFRNFLNDMNLHFIHPDAFK